MQINSRFFNLDGGDEKKKFEALKRKLLKRMEEYMDDLSDKEQAGMEVLSFLEMAKSSQNEGELRMYVDLFADSYPFLKKVLGDVIGEEIADESEEIGEEIKNVIE